MDKLIIRGGHSLNGEIEISGAKNAALPELCAALLTDQEVVLRNVPKLQDVSTMLKLIRNMGVTCAHEDDGTVRLNAGALNKPEAPYEMVKTMRASVLALGLCWPDSDTPRSRCRAVAPLVLDLSISTSKVCKPWARKSMWNMATWWLV